MTAVAADTHTDDDRLYPYQLEGVHWLRQRQCGLLADDMGLGKTAQALSAAPSRAPLLVLCPGGLRSVWQTELQSWRPDLRVHVIPTRRLYRQPEPGEAVICSYEMMPAAHSPPAPGTVVIADEAHKLKTHGTRRNLSALQLFRKTRERRGRVWLLSATPILNKPPELWMMLRLMGAHLECYGSAQNFAKQFGGVRGSLGMLWDGCEKRIQPGALAPVRPHILRRTKAQVLPDLPPKSYRTIVVPSPHERSTLRLALDELVDETDRIIADFESGYYTPSASMMTARKELAVYKSQHPVFLQTVESFAEAEEPLIVFSVHRDPIMVLGDGKGWGKVIGGQTPTQRTQAVDAFQTHHTVDNLAATIGAAGHGLTLTRAAFALFIDQSFVPADNLQAEDRIVRIGQKRPTVIINLVCDHHVDKRIHQILEAKSRLLAATTDRLVE